MLSLLALLLAAPVPDDTLEVRPGHPAVDASTIAPYEVVWVQFFQSGDRRTLRRTIVDRVDREEGADEPRLVRTQTFLGLDGEPTSRRVNRVHGTTLAPRDERWRFGERVTHVHHDGARVAGAMLSEEDGEAPLAFDRELPEPGFDFNTLPLLLSAVPLREGLSLSFPQVVISPPTLPVPEIDRVTIEIEGREEVDAGPLGRVRAWRAVDAEHDMVLWMIPQAPYLVRVSFPVDEETLSVIELGVVRSAAGDD